MHSLSSFALLFFRGNLSIFSAASLLGYHRASCSFVLYPSRLPELLEPRVSLAGLRFFGGTGFSVFESLILTSCHGCLLKRTSTPLFFQSSLFPTFLFSFTELKNLLLVAYFLLSWSDTAARTGKDVLSRGSCSSFLFPCVVSVLSPRHSFFLPRSFGYEPGGWVTT